jgi:predicted nucleic acid-binding protein
VVVADSSPLIYLAALSDFELLPRLFGEIQIPPAVWLEIVEQGAGFPVREFSLQAADKAWLKVTPLLIPAEPIQAPGGTLHRGETEVIRLGEQLRAGILLMDDRRAVAHARAMGFRVAPTITIYIEAKRQGMIRSVKEKVDQLLAARFRLTEQDYKAVLAAAGEL